MRIDEKKWNRFRKIVGAIWVICFIALYTWKIKDHISDNLYIQALVLFVFWIIVGLVEELVFSVIKSSVFLNKPFRVKDDITSRIFEPIEMQDKLGRDIFLRSVEVTDVKELVEYMDKTPRESQFLLREPDECKLTIKQELDFVNGVLSNPKAFMLVAICGGKLIGNAMISPIGSFRKVNHRCEIAIALYKEYYNAGIGKAMLDRLMEIAKELGYEQAELEVVSTNERAIHLYENVGFVVYGTKPNNMKYADGTYVDALYMVKKL